jgi:uncharacterized repeat protein (TIGR03837 family)
LHDIKEELTAHFEMKSSIHSCDIFCKVIDNYGDIGVCWRLSKLMANEYGLAVRLWVDDLNSFARLCKDINPALEQQMCRGVEVRLWDDKFPVVQPADVVIEAFACKLPESYITAMVQQEPQPAWINLEYLSAEGWVESNHKLPSPHPTLQLVKYFFFPGFTRQTGGLLLECDLFARRDAFQRDSGKQQAFWKSVGMNMPTAETMKISLFSYENTALSALFDAWAANAQPVLCLVPEGRILPQVGQYFGDPAPNIGKEYLRGNLHVLVLPFIEQERYDELLWACDVNFVRGEDSLARALWTGRPFVWQIYPQHDAVHMHKLQAFLMLYGERLSRQANQAVTGLWQAWNFEGEVGQAWAAFAAQIGEINSSTRDWARLLAKNNLALNLLDFCGEIGRMRALKIEG